MIKQKLIQFLQAELSLPAQAIDLGLRYCEQTPSLLPTVLWQFGLISLEQLDQVFEWMENA
jgi:hypothetical protein